MGLGNYRGAAFTTSCGDLPKYNCRNKTEILDMTTMRWSDAPDYPYLPLDFLIGIHQYSTAHTVDSVFIIGGYHGRFSYIFAQFKDDQWSQFGYLNQRRCQHGSITINRQTMVIGGKTIDFPN